MGRESLGRRLPLMGLDLSHVTNSLSKIQLPLLPKSVLLQRLEAEIVGVLLRPVLRQATLARKITLRNRRHAVHAITQDGATLM